MFLRRNRPHNLLLPGTLLSTGSIAPRLAYASHVHDVGQ
jgi:hypothetical protein